MERECLCGSTSADTEGKRWEFYFINNGHGSQSKEFSKSGCSQERADFINIVLQFHTHTDTRLQKSQTEGRQGSEIKEQKETKIYKKIESVGNAVSEWMSEWNSEREREKEPKEGEK